MSLYIKRTYQQILEDRRLLRVFDSTPILGAQEKPSHYLLELQYGPNNHYCVVEKSSVDYLDFQTHRLPYVNTKDRPQGKTPSSHNMGDSSTWENGKNYYLFEPTPSKEWLIKNIMGKMHSDTKFGAGHSFVLAVWIGVTQPCPDANPLSPTAISMSPFDGWFDITPEDEKDQFFQLWANFDPANYPPEAATFTPEQWGAYLQTQYPRYVCKKYSYDTVEKMLIKPDYQAYAQGFYKVDFKFSELYIDVMLKSSMKSRIEVYYDDGQNMDTPVKKDDGLGGLVATDILSYIQVRGVEFIEW